MKKSIILFIFLLLSLCLTGAEYNGSGEALLGNGITIEQADEIATLIAQKDALQKYGTYIETTTEIKDYQITKDEIAAIAKGVVKLKKDTKTIKKEMRNGEIYILVAGVFFIEDNDSSKLIEKYKTMKNDNQDLRLAINKLNDLEKKLELLSKDKNTTNIDFSSNITEQKELSINLTSGLSIDGKAIVQDLNKKLKNSWNQQISDLKQLKNYWLEVRPYADISDQYDIKISEPEITKISETNPEIKITVDFKIKEDVRKKLDSINRKYLNLTEKPNSWNVGSGIIFIDENSKILPKSCYLGAYNTPLFYYKDSKFTTYNSSFKDGNGILSLVFNIEKKTLEDTSTIFFIQNYASQSQYYRDTTNKFSDWSQIYNKFLEEISFSNKLYVDSEINSIDKKIAALSSK